MSCMKVLAVSLARDLRNEFAPAYALAVVIADDTQTVSVLSVFHRVTANFLREMLIVFPEVCVTYPVYWL